MSVGMPHAIALDEFGAKIWEVFGTTPFLVGSALTEKRQWHDVDVRLIIEDYEWDHLDLGPPVAEGGLPLGNAKWRALCWAFSLLGREMTGLPIDFQIQRKSEANAQYDGERSAIGLVPWRHELSERYLKGLTVGASARRKTGERSD